MHLADIQPSPLLQVSRHVHNEALHIFLQSNTFKFDIRRRPFVGDDGPDISDLDSLRNISGLDLVRNIAVRVPWGISKLCGTRIESAMGRIMARVLEHFPCARTLTVHHHYLHSIQLSIVTDFLEKSVPVIKKWSHLEQIKVVGPCEIVAETWRKKGGVESSTAWEADHDKRRGRD